MITEDYVSFETAKLLKEKGYKGSFNDYYNNAGCVVNRPNAFLKEPEYQYYERVSLQMAMKWLREMYSLMVVVHPSYPIDGIKYESLIYRLTELKDASVDEYNYNNKEYNNYKEACEAAIRYCLENLI